MPATTAPGRVRPADGPAVLRALVLARVLHGLGVLLVVVGVLAMHAVAGGSHLAGMHSPAPVTSEVTVVAVSGPMRAGSMPAGSAHASAHLQSVRLSGHLAGALVAPPADVGSGMGAACVAVLFGLLLLTARTSAGTAKPAAPPVPRGAGHGTAPRGRGPPRQLLAQLCVLRT